MSFSGCGRLTDADSSPHRRLDPAAEHAAEEAAPEDEGIDHFDRLPDAVLLVVFNRIGDIKALGRCCVVSRRFQTLVPLVEDVVVRVDCVIADDPSASPATYNSAAASAVSRGDKARGVFSNIARLLLGGLVKPLQALGQILVPSPFVVTAGGSSTPRRSISSSSSSEVSHHSPTEVLRNFKEIRRLRIELPAGELGIEEGVLLKWKACFGSTLDRSVILGASSILSPSTLSKSSSSNLSVQEVCGVAEDNGSIPESFYTNGSLKLRVVWTISSLIAASARHYLLQPIIAEHETLETLELTDADGQGVLSMDSCHLQELRVKPVSASGSSQRTLVPALSMRLWYAPHLELPCGLLLKGATLVAMRPSEEPIQEVANGVYCGMGSSDGCWAANAFEEPYRTAAKMLMNRRTYCLEMNSF